MTVPKDKFRRPKQIFTKESPQPPNDPTSPVYFRAVWGGGARVVTVTLSEGCKHHLIFSPLCSCVSQVIQFACVPLSSSSFSGFLAYSSPILIKIKNKKKKTRSEFSGIQFFPLSQGPCVLGEGLLDPLNCHHLTRKQVRPGEAVPLAVTSHTPPRILIWATLLPFVPRSEDSL